MSGTHFTFKQFKVYHDKCAMKVGTDGVLLGSLFTPLKETNTVLDIGTGTGLVALMAAQRLPNATIHAIEINALAAQQARDNFALSPFAHQLVLHEGDVTQMAIDKKFELILSNPPYFNTKHYTVMPDGDRKQARQTETLDFESLVTFVSKHLNSLGLFWVILPYDLATAFIGIGLNRGLYLQHRINIQSKPQSKWVRCIMRFGFEPKELKIEGLTLYTPEGERSQAYRLHTQDFYL